MEKCEHTNSEKIGWTVGPGVRWDLMSCKDCAKCFHVDMVDPPRGLYHVSDLDQRPA